MTVKFSSLHIKRRSLLTFPQTGMKEHWLREDEYCRNVLKTGFCCTGTPHVSNNTQKNASNEPGPNMQGLKTEQKLYDKTLLTMNVRYQVAS